MVWSRGPVSCGCPVVSAPPFVEKTVFLFTEFSWHPCWKAVDNKFMGLFPDSWFYFIHLYVHPYASNTIDLFTLSFLFVKFWKWEASQVCSFSRLFWLFLGLLYFHMGFKINLLVSTKKAYRILKEIAFNLYINLGMTAILNLPTHKHGYISFI